MSGGDLTPVARNDPGVMTITGFAPVFEPGLLIND
jgi:hypothetical protein